MPAVSQSWSLIRRRRGPVPSLTIREANSTPMVWEERTRPGGVSLVCRDGVGLYVHSSLTNRWRTQDLGQVSEMVSWYL